MTEPKKRGAAPGENRGKGNQGRKAFARKLKVVTFRLYEDQLPISSADARAAIDEYKDKFGAAFATPKPK